MTTLTGTLTINGTNVTGTLWLELSQQAFAGGGVVLSPTTPYSFPLVNGAIVAPGGPPYSVYGNDILTPAATFYRMTVYDSNGSQLLRGNVSITGGSVDISTFPTASTQVWVAPPGYGVALVGDASGLSTSNTVTGIRGKNVSAPPWTPGHVLTVQPDQSIAPVPVGIAAPGISGLTAGKIPKASSGTTIADSLITESVGRVDVAGTVGGALEDKGGQVYNIEAFGVKSANSATVNTAALNALFAALPYYATVFAPGHTYPILGGITITKPVRLVGAGNGTMFAVDPSVNAATDIFHIVPSADGHYFEFRDFAVAPASTVAGRNTFYLDGTTNYVGDTLFDNLVLARLNGISIKGDGSGAGEGMPVITTIRNSVLNGGLAFPNCGDTVRVLNNHITGTGTYALDVAFQAGASTLIFKGNSVTNDLGIHIGGKSVATQIVENEFETFNTFTGSNGAFVDIDGTVGNPAESTIIARNSFQIVNGITTNTIRVNYATGTHIFSNRFGRGLGASKDILITANAVGTAIGTNLWASGGPLSSMVSDAGTDTVFLGAWAGAAWATKKHIVSVGASGVDEEQIRFNRNNDGNRYNSIYSKSNDSGSAFVSVRVHDGVTATSQRSVMGWFGNGLTAFLSMPPSFANNAAAIAGGLTVGCIYRTGADSDVLCVVH